MKMKKNSSLNNVVEQKKPFDENVIL